MPETPEHGDEVLSEKDLKIRALNDQFRETLLGGRVVITKGVGNLGQAFLNEALQKLRAFNAFTPENDPYGTHEFGNFEVAGRKLWFKIDAYDRDLCYGSPDPSDPALTIRVLTLLLPEEY